MATYLKSFQLLNFQSWSNESPNIELCPDTLNVIEGPNETGKSVFFKVFYNMVFPGYWSAVELIRRGYSTAAMILNLADESTLVYTLERGHRTLILQDSNGEEQVWRDYKQFPNELIEHLGLVVDFNSKVILNVIDKDVPLPFIKSSPSLNASHFKAIVEPPAITEFYESLKIKLSDTEYARSIFSRAASNMHSAAAVLEYADVNILKAKLNEVDVALAGVRIYDNFLDSMHNTLEMLHKKPNEVMDPRIVEGSIFVFDMIHESCNVISNILLHMKSKPTKVNLSSAVPLELNSFDRLCELTNNLTEVTEYILKKPVNILLPPLLATELAAYDVLVALRCSLQSAVELSLKKPEMILLPDVTPDIEVLDKLEKCCDDMLSLAILIEDVSQLYSVQVAVKNEMDEIRETVGVCPVCGRLLEENAE